MYRGYPVDQLAEQVQLSGSLLPAAATASCPTPTQMEEFRDAITHHTMLNESLGKFYDGFHYDAHPMAMLTGIVGLAVGLLSRHHRHP